MQKQVNANAENRQDEEIHDILIAISVIAKRLANKLRTLDMETDSMESKDGGTEK